MKNTLAFLAVCLVLCLCRHAYGQDPVNYADCLKQTSTMYGTPCAQCPVDEKTMRVYFTNTCDESIEVTLAMKDDIRKRVRIFKNRSLAPSDSISGYICDGNARFYYWARKAGDKSVELPTDKEIMEYYGKRDY